MNIYHKVQLFDLEQPGMKKEKRVIRILYLESHKKAKSSVSKVFNKDGIQKYQDLLWKMLKPVKGN